MYIVSQTCVGHFKDHSMSRVSFMILKGAQGVANYSPFAEPKLMQTSTRRAIRHYITKVRRTARSWGNIRNRALDQRTAMVNNFSQGKLLQGATKKQTLPACECNYLTGLELIPPTANICCHHNHTSIFTRKHS